VNGWGIFISAFMLVVFLPFGVLGLAALAVAGDADRAAGRDEAAT
jgi:hypothetical protein